MPGFFWRLKDFFANGNRQPNNYIPGKDGHVYLVKDSRLGRLVLKARNVPMVDSIHEGFEFTLPKIPAKMLQIALSFFRAYWNDEVQNEVMLRIVFDTKEQRYLFDCPEQFVSREAIHAPDVGIDFPEPRYLDVLHIHSHHIMPAEFSVIDDLNERKYRLYVVVGHMDHPVPEISVRVGHGGSFVYLPVDYIFDSSDLSYHLQDYPIEWEKRVTITK